MLHAMSQDAAPAVGDTSDGAVNLPLVVAVRTVCSWISGICQVFFALGCSVCSVGLFIAFSLGEDWTERYRPSGAGASLVRIKMGKYEDYP